jgi:hypothetical protein
METILQSILEVGGVTATMVLDGGGRVVAHRGRAVYDRSTCEQVGGPLLKAVESIQLQHEDWDTITAQFADGRILLRNLGRAGARGHVLAVVADPTLNASFATVAIRVAANKLRAALEGGAQSAVAAHLAQSTPAAASAARGAESATVLAQAGVSWSKSAAAGASSAAGVSGVSAADAASTAFLTLCRRELARHVGPMSKLYVQEAAHRVSPDAPFSMPHARALLEELAGQIADPKDRALFRKALEKA